MKETVLTAQSVGGTDRGTLPLLVFILVTYGSLEHSSPLSCITVASSLSLSPLLSIPVYFFLSRPDVVLADI